jgi:hypothetical protein
MGRFVLWGAAVAAVVGFGLFAPAERAEAVGLCNCCETSLTPSCGKVCAVISLAPGMCPAIVDYEGTGATVPGANPLNGMSLKDMALGDPRPGQLEKFREFLETGRRRAITSYKAALRKLKRHKITQADFDKADGLYKEALVNYYHGIRAYLNRVGRKSD